MAYYIFHDEKDFWKKVNDLKSIGYTWIQESHFDYNPTVTQKDIPVILNIDEQKTMMFSIIDYYKSKYFSDPEFVRLYSISLRKKKLETILNGKK